MKKLETFKLKRVHHCSFRKSEATNYEEFRRKHGKEIGPGDLGILVSQSRDQIVWLLGRRVVDGRNVLDTRRWRITHGGTWSMLMLQNYANEIGIDIEGLKRFEQFHERTRKVVRRAEQVAYGRSK